MPIPRSAPDSENVIFSPWWQLAPAVLCLVTGGCVSGPEGRTSVAGTSEADGGTSEADTDATDLDSGDGDGGDDMDTVEPLEDLPSCLDSCSPDALPGCSDGETALECSVGEDGCYAFEQSPCQEGTQCVANFGCVAPLPESCQVIHDEDPQAPDGAYMIDPDGFGGLPGFEVVCDMTTDGGGWTLIAYNDQTTNFEYFDRNWQAYRDGFGMLVAGGRGWLGNERIHALTAGGVELQVRHNHAWANVYANFSVGDEASQYELSVSNTPNSLDGGWFVAGHNGMGFTTFDHENDTHPDLNCAVYLRAGWWYGACAHVSIAAGESDASQVYWRPPPPNDGAPLWVEWIGMWIR